MTEKANLEPLPYSEVTLITPPISVTSCLQMARPRPEPAGFATRLSEILVKSVKSLAQSDACMPTPVSSTSMRTMWFVSVSVSLKQRTQIVPSFVNLMAFESRFSTTWRRRSPSPTTICGTERMSTTRSMPRASACMRTSCAAPSSAEHRLKGCHEISSCPASIFERSRMSLMRFSSSVEHVRASVTCRCATSCSFCSSSSSSMPSSPLSGVRSSCEKEARKAVLVCSIFLRAVKSCPTPTTPVICPALSILEEALSSSVTSSLPCVCSGSSKDSVSVPASASSSTSVTAVCSELRMKSSTRLRPMTSEGAKPVTCAIFWFQMLMQPLRSTPKMGAFAFSIKRVYSCCCERNCVMSCPMPITPVISSRLSWREVALSSTSTRLPSLVISGNSKLAVSSPVSALSKTAFTAWR